jgi:hypothetical protein
MARSLQCRISYGSSHLRKVTVVRPIHKVLVDAAQNAVRRYQYDPARRTGVPEVATVTETVLSGFARRHDSPGSEVDHLVATHAGRACR